MDPLAENSTWVFDSLVGFLHGPIWNVPLQTFIEEKSLPFEPTESGEVCDKPEYMKIFDEYRNLVDTMLGSFMEDLGITAAQFEEACRRSRSDLAGLPPPFHRRLFEQVWAANDYAMFTKMMTHRNVELQLQALELIEREFGALPHLFLPDDLADLTYPDAPRSEDDHWPDADDIMAEVKKLQLSDASDDDDVVKAPDRSVVVAEKKILKSKLVSFEKNSPGEPVAPPDFTEETCSEQQNDNTESAPPKREVSAEEVQKRQEYLKMQRDKLLAIKRQVRSRRLEMGGGDVARPASARAAHALLAGTPSAAPPPPDASLLLRRALADRLKAEVVDGQR